MKKTLLFCLALFAWTTSFAEIKGAWQETLHNTDWYLIFTDEYCYEVNDLDSKNAVKIERYCYGFTDNADVNKLSVSQLKDNGKYLVLTDPDMKQGKKYDGSHFKIYSSSLNLKQFFPDEFELARGEAFHFVAVERLNKKIEAYMKKHNPELFSAYKVAYIPGEE